MKNAFLNNFRSYYIYMKNKANIKKYCKKIVKTNAILPTGSRIMNGLWVVASQIPLRFSVVWHDKEKTVSEFITQSPLSFVQLNMSCSASNYYLTLTPYFHQESENEPHFELYRMLQVINITNVDLWETFYETFHNISSIKVPSTLKVIK